MTTPPLQFPDGPKASRKPSQSVLDNLKAMESLAETVELGEEEPDRVLVSEAEPRLFGDEKVRKAVESRCGPLRFDDLVTTGKILQKVPIKPGAFEVTYQTITGSDEVFCTELAYVESAGSVTHAKVYLLMEMACGIHAINGEPLPPYFDADGKRDRKMFDTRWRRVGDMPAPLLKHVYKNYGWFVDRVDGLTVMDDLKNG